MLSRNSSRSPFRNKTKKKITFKFHLLFNYQSQFHLPLNRFIVNNRSQLSNQSLTKLGKLNSNRRNAQIVLSADCKILQHPGLMNIGRKVNYNKYGRIIYIVKFQQSECLVCSIDVSLWQHNESNAKFKMYCQIHSKKKQ